MKELKIKTQKERWQFLLIEKKLPPLVRPVCIIGLPGIGNVGKIAADFLIQELHAKKIVEIRSTAFPHAVFVNEENLIDSPIVEIYAAQGKNKRDFLLIVGDVQPINEEACYQFCYALVDFLQSLNTQEIVTMGGIGLRETKNPPKVFCTGNNQALIDAFVKGKPKDFNLNPKIFGVVGPIIGVTGLLLAVAQQAKIPAIALLAETIAHPAFVGIKGSREVVKVLDEEYKLGINIDNLEKEIKGLEQMQRRAREMLKLQQQAKAETLGQDYIG